MLRVVRRIVVTLLLGGVLMAGGLLVAPPASACSCVGGTTQEFLDRADAVFTGRLLSRDPERPDGPASAALHVFAVDTVLKGVVHERQGVVSPQSGASCGLELSGDGPFVVFATRSTDLGGTPFAVLEDGQYAAFLCGGTAPLTPTSEAELAAATAGGGPPAGPLPGAAGTVASGPDVLVPALVGAGALAALLALVARRRRRARP